MEYDQQQNTPRTDGNINFANEVKDFYAGDFKALFLTFFLDPFEGIAAIFRRPSEKSFIHSLVLYGSIFVLYFLGIYLLAGGMRDYLTFGALLSMGLIPVMVMVCISGLSFLIKAVAGRANFRSELLTGALCGIPLGLIIPLSLVARVLGEEGDIMMWLRNPLGAGSLMGLLLFYFLIMMINVFQQSLKAGGVRDMLAWYLSPFCILISFYIAFNVFSNF